MNEVIDTALVSLFEKRLEGRAEAILNWYRENFTSDRIQDVPEELAREISPPSAAVSEILVPEFLTKMPGLTNGPPMKAGPLVSESAASPREVVPEELTRVIFWRTEEAEVELHDNLNCLVLRSLRLGITGRADAQPRLSATAYLRTLHCKVDPRTLITEMAATTRQ